MLLQFEIACGVEFGDHCGIVLMNFVRFIFILFVTGTVVLTGSVGKTVSLSVVEFSHAHEVKNHGHEHPHDHHHDETPADSSKDGGHHHSHEITVNANYVVAAFAYVSTISLPEPKGNDPIRGSTLNNPKSRALGSIFRPPIA